MKKISINGEEYFEDLNGLKQGEFRHSEPDGLVVYRCMFKDDQEHGEFKEYYYSPEYGVSRRGIFINGSEVESLVRNKIYDLDDQVILSLKYGTFGWLDEGN